MMLLKMDILAAEVQPEIPNLESKLNKLARNGFKHHTTVGVGHMKKVLEEAFKYYLGYEIVNID